MNTKKVKFSVRTIEELTEELNKILSNNSEYKLDNLEIDYYPPNKTYYIYIANLSKIEDDYSISEQPVVTIKCKNRGKVTSVKRGECEEFKCRPCPTKFKFDDDKIDEYEERLSRYVDDFNEAIENLNNEEK